MIKTRCRRIKSLEKYCVYISVCCENKCHFVFSVASLDHVATETLAKCEEKFPIITKHPSEVCSNA